MPQALQPGEQRSAGRCPSCTARPWRASPAAPSARPATRPADARISVLTSKVTPPSRTGPASSTRKAARLTPAPGSARDQEQPARREQQHEAQMAPAVAPAAQVGRARAPVAGAASPAPRPARRPAKLARTTISEANSMPGHCSPSPRTASRRKARRPQWKSWTGAVKNRRPRARQDRVADPAVLPRHGTRQDRPAARRQAAAHDQIRATTQRRQEQRQLAEIVGAVGVAHQDEPAARRGDAAGQRVAVAALGDLDHPRPGGQRPRLRAVGAAIVGDQHLAHDARPPPAPPPPRATQAARVSASFRQGIRIVSSTPGCPLPRHRPRTASRATSPTLSSRLQPAPGPRPGAREASIRRGCHPPQQGL